MMYGHEKSDPAIVAVKPANKAERSAAELAERRVGTKGNAGQLSTRRTQSRVSVSHALERIRQNRNEKRNCRYTPKVGAVCPNWACTDLCGLCRASALNSVA
jgi:RNA-directed DNA polymerase